MANRWKKIEFSPLNQPFCVPWDIQCEIPFHTEKPTQKKEPHIHIQTLRKYQTITHIKNTWSHSNTVLGPNPDLLKSWHLKSSNKHIRYEINKDPPTYLWLDSVQIKIYNDVVVKVERVKRKMHWCKKMAFNIYFKWFAINKTNSWRHASKSIIFKIQWNYFK